MAKAAYKISGIGWAILDDQTGEFFGFFRKVELTQTVNQTTRLLSDVPTTPPNATLIAWAKDNYPMQGEYNQQRARYQKIIDDANANLALITTAGG